MANTGRVDKTLFTEDHYLGKPADDNDRIVTRRIAILKKYPEFFGKDLSCIEIGCGGGTTIARVANRFAKTLGIDIFDYSSEFAHQVAIHNAHNCTFRHVDLESEKLQEKFERLISFEVIEHLKTEDNVKVYADVLKPGALAAITVPNKWWIFETHGARLPVLPWNRVPFFSWLPKFIHERYANARIYTKSRIVKLLRRHGFEVIDTCYVTAPMDVLKDGKLKRLLTKYIFRSDSTGVPFLATSIFVIAQKKIGDD